MLTVYDVQLGLRDDATIGEVLKLRDHFKALKINAIGLDHDDFKGRSDKLFFTIYGDFGPFMMKKIVEECTEKIFPGCFVGLSQGS